VNPLWHFTPTPFMLFCVLLLAACAQKNQTYSVGLETLPHSWSTQTDTAQQQTGPWLEVFDSPGINALVELALSKNYRLAQQAALLEIAEQRVITSGAELLPSLDFRANGQRQKRTGSIDEQFGLNLSVSYELDIWGKLSNRQKQGQLNFSSQQASYLQSQRNLAAEVINASFSASSAAQLLELLEQRLVNLEQSLDVIQRGYRSGLNESLDVYLSQSTLEQQRANVANQLQIKFESLTRLELLVASYPGARLKISSELPDLPTMPATGLPSHLIQLRPDIQQAWLDLLAADAGVAIAHKERFPSLTLSGNLNDSSTNFGELLGAGPLGWTLGASILQPLFQGGRLKALEQQAKFQLRLQEKNYLDVVYRAFAEVENTLHLETVLEQRYGAILRAESLAEAALSLAFAQYQRGLVNYTTVLESQRRAFDAQTTVIQLKSQRLQNRVKLSLALGGAY